MRHAFITLFELLTLDNWSDVYQDMKLVGNSTFSICYIVAWILIGAFVFSNIFIGFMGISFFLVSGTRIVWPRAKSGAACMSHPAVVLVIVARADRPTPLH